MRLAPPSAPPPGWYEDPWHRAAFRWWDGQAWSWQVHTPPPPPRAPERRNLPTLPIAAGVWGLATVTAVIVGLQLVAAVAAALLPVIPAVIVVTAALYAPMAAYCVYASRRWGIGNVTTDLGAQIRPIDAALGLAVVFVALQIERLVFVLVDVLGVPVTSNTEGLSGSDDRALYLTLAAVAIVAAPIVEELFFRGLLLSSLRSRLGAVPAIAVQAVLFGAYHAAPVYGWGNIGLVIILATVGAVFGAAVQLTGRLGPSIVGHALLNAAVFVVLLATT
jgi:membrane protease YdiL (CAAX protease family)